MSCRGTCQASDCPQARKTVQTSGFTVEHLSSQELLQSQAKPEGKMLRWETILADISAKQLL